MAGGLANFGGKKAAPFGKGGKRRAKVLVAKAAVKGAKRSASKSADLSHVDLASAPMHTVNNFQPKPYDANDEAGGEPVVCPNCGKGDAADARYCDQCGFKLQGANGVKVRGA